MAAEGDASQPAPAGNEKSQASKAAPSFVSTFINKNTGGKKFAPKAARRRPGAAAPSASQRPSTPPPSSTVPETQATQAAPATESQATLQDALPTPATTQETSSQEVLRIEQTDRELRAPEISIETASPVATPDATPSQPIVGDSVDQPGEGTHTTQPAVSRRAEEELDSSHPRKRQRVENAHDVVETSVSEPHVPAPIQDASAQVETTQPDTQIAIEPTPGRPQAGTAQSIAEQIPATSIATAPVDATTVTNEGGEESEATTLEVPAPVQPRRGQRRVSWVTVNQQGGDEAEGIEPDASTQLPGKTSDKGRITPANEAGEVGAEGDDAEVEVATGRTTRGRTRRSTVDSTANEWEPEALPKPPPKARKPRKDKGTKKKKQGVPGQEGQDGEEAEVVTEEGQRPRKKRAPRRKKAGAQTGTGEEEEEVVDGAAEDDTQPRRPKGRRREATPSDAEDQVIDTANTFMDGLASHRGPRTGQVSQREHKMRNIDWEAVKQRRREENAIGVDPVGSRRAVDEALAQAGEARAEALAAQSRGPQFREVNGQIVLIQEAAVIDREADADREIELMEEVEEDDLTSRVTAASYLREDKRFPKEFLLPGQGKRWNSEGTEAFYDALQMFGTDFMMISTLFPGTTRRSIKTKFNREERENPLRIKEALNGQRNSNWAEYLSRAGMEDDAFVDPTVIENELQEEREKMRVNIEAAKQAKAEEDRQKDLAGVLRDEKDGEKENEDGRRKKKRKEKAKTVGFEPEEGVEILPLDDED